MFKTTSQSVSARQYIARLTKVSRSYTFHYDSLIVFVPSDTADGTIIIDSELSLDYQIIANGSGELFITFDPIHTGE